MSQFCNNCGAPVNPGAGFCPACGVETRAEGPSPGPPRSGHDQAPGPFTKRQIPGTGYNRNPGAATVGGPGVPGQAPTGLLQIITRAVTDFLKDPKQLIPLAALAVFWLILSLLAAQGINPLPVKFLSFLTFAQGGMYAGVWGAIGGIIGKAVFAYFFSVLIMPLFSGKNPFKQMGSGFKGLLGGLAIQSGSAAAELMLGLGPALILFNFFTGNASFVNSMAGIAGFFLSLKLLWSKGGLVRSLLIALARKLSRGRIPSEITVNRAISGFAAGSALGVILTAVPLPYFPYLVGAIVLVAGIILSITLKAPGGVRAA